MEATDHSHTASNGRADLSLDDLAALHGGLAKFMLDISTRATRCYQACQARNAKVARHQLSALIRLLKHSVLVRPQYGEAIERFIAEDLSKLRAVIDAERWGSEFDEVWNSMTISVNRYHEEFDHGYLVWRVPQGGESDLDLSPR